MLSLPLQESGFTVSSSTFLNSLASFSLASAACSAATRTSLQRSWRRLLLDFSLVSSKIEKIKRTWSTFVLLESYFSIFPSLHTTLILAWQPAFMKHFNFVTKLSSSTPAETIVCQTIWITILIIFLRQTCLS